MLTQQRARFAPLKLWVGRFLGRLPLPPEFWTWSGLGLALLSAFAYPRWGAAAACAAGTLSAAMDFVDGAVARHQGRVSAWGNYLEAIVDRGVEITLLLSLAPRLGTVVAWALAASLLISYCKPRAALVVPGDNHDWPGMGDHADRTVLILLATLVSGWCLPLARALLAGLTAMALIGCWQRINYARKLIFMAELGRIDPEQRMACPDCRAILPRWTVDEMEAGPRCPACGTRVKLPEEVLERARRQRYLGKNIDFTA